MLPIVLYTTSYCPYCRSAKALLDQKGFAYQEKDLTDKPSELIALKAKTGWRTVPQIFIGEHFVGGFDALKSLEDSGELDKVVNGQSIPPEP